jgi:hypothetical protein
MSDHIYKTRVQYNGEWHSIKMSLRDIELATVIEVIIDDEKRHIFMRQEDAPESQMTWTQDNEGETELSKALTDTLDTAARKYYEATAQNENEQIVDDLDF